MPFGINPWPLMAAIEQAESGMTKFEIREISNGYIVSRQIEYRSVERAAATLEDALQTVREMQADAIAQAMQERARQASDP